MATKIVPESDMEPRLPENISNGRYYLWCPGCYERAKLLRPEGGERGWMLTALHCFSTKVHGFNGNMEAPTLTPSLLVTYAGSDKSTYCCHSFVNDGKIQFLGDCTHPLANQTVDLLDAPEMEEEAA